MVLPLVAVAAAPVAWPWIVAGGVALAGIAGGTYWSKQKTNQANIALETTKEETAQLREAAAITRFDPVAGAGFTPSSLDDWGQILKQIAPVLFVAGGVLLLVVAVTRR